MDLKIAIQVLFQKGAVNKVNKTSNPEILIENMAKILNDIEIDDFDLNQSINDIKEASNKIKEQKEIINNKKEENNIN